MAHSFIDGIVSLYNSLTNERNPASTNTFQANRIADSETRALMLSGIGNRIITLITSTSLNKTIQFDDKNLETFYNQRLAKAVKKASKFQLAFGRGVIVINEKGKDLSKPISDQVNIQNTKFDVFSGDMVYPLDYGTNLTEDRYYEIKAYGIRGYEFHHSRIIDFNFVEPAELDKPQYRFGGVSLFELIRAQLINDGVIERAGASIIEKNSTLFYSVNGLKETMQSGQESELVKYFSALEGGRGISGAGLLDAEDSVTVVNQTLADYDKVAENALRRIAMVTGIPVSILIGESVKGLNATGDSERQTFNETVANHQSEYLIDPINNLLQALGKEPVSFKDNQGQTPNEKVLFDGLVIENSVKLASMGEDFSAYLNEFGIGQEDDFDKVFGTDENS